MSTLAAIYRGHRFPPEVISYSIWAYHRFSLSFRDVEDLLAERGVIVSNESVRRWCQKFGPSFQRSLKRREGTLGDDWFVDEVFITINDQRFYLWRAVDQDGDDLDILVQNRRDRKAAERFFRKVLRGQHSEPRRVVTDGLRSYPPALRAVLPTSMHDTEKYANNRAKNSHRPTRQRRGRCSGSSPDAMLNGSSDFTLESATCFETADIC